MFAHYRPFMLMFAIAPRRRIWYTTRRKDKKAMSATYTYWQDPKDGLFVGYWNEYPDYVTQGHDLPELQFMLRDIRDAIRDGDLQDTHRSVGVMEYA